MLHLKNDGSILVGGASAMLDRICHFHKNLKKTCARDQYSKPLTGNGYFSCFSEILMIIEQ